MVAYPTGYMRGPNDHGSGIHIVYVVHQVVATHVATDRVSGRADPYEGVMQYIAKLENINVCGSIFHWRTSSGIMWKNLEPHIDAVQARVVFSP